MPLHNSYNDLNYLDRVISTGSKTAYLKIAEGCSNNCTYCAIPYIRGPYKSRKIEDVIEEAKSLEEKGIEEIILIAQDTTKYGIDIYGESKLAFILQELCKIKGFKWIRLLYSYPESITDELMNVVKTEDKICKYFDIPIQHISDKVLKRMNRKSNSESIRKLIKKIRNNIPGVILRTTLITGFPGETKEDFEELVEFVKTAEFDKLGVFAYSKEDGTPASRLKEQVHPQTKKARAKKIMELQKEISAKKLKGKIGKIYTALIEGITEDNKYYVSRTQNDVPQMDGVTFIKPAKNRNIGDFINCKIVEVSEYDFFAEEIDK